MFFKDQSQIARIAESAETAIFAVPLPDLKGMGIKPFFVLEPDEKNKILVDATREMISACALKQSSDTYVVINHAEALNEQSQNALLKLLEEPHPFYHFLLFTLNPMALLETIRSRAEVYYPWVSDPLSRPVEYSEEVKEMARSLLKMSQREVIGMMESLTKGKKDDLRGHVLTVIAAAIEIAYKSYFATGNVAFLQKLPGLINCYTNIKNNGHIKLHLVADLI